jgi:hypothetical protein
VTRATYAIRNIEGSSVLDGDYLCERAVEKLVLAWKFQRGAWIDESEGHEVDSFAECSPEFYEVLYKAGSSKFKAPGPIGKMTMHEYVLLPPPSPHMKVMGRGILMNGTFSIPFSAKTREVGVILTT